MGFASGSITFRRFAVIGEQPASIDQDLLDKLSENALRPGEFGVPEEIEYGWSGGRHILDGQFSFEHNVFADTLHFALRIDTNQVPGDLKKAYHMMEEEAVAATNPSGFISKNQKRDVKDTVRRKLDEDLKSGRFRKSKLLPILWDLPTQTLFCQATGTNLEKLHEIFERTFGLELQPLSAGAQGLRLLEPQGRRRDYEDLRPSRFALGPEGESQHPEYPWVAKGPEPKDFLGNEFLLWLWHASESHSGAVTTEQAGAISLFIDKSLDLDCAYGATGKDSLRGDGPGKMPEAKDALRSGKLPRKSGLVMDVNNQQFTFTFNPEALGFGSLKLPEIEDADTPRTLFEERIALLRDFCKSVDALFATFLKVRTGSAWEGQCTAIRKWIAQSVKQIAAVA